MTLVRALGRAWFAFFKRCVPSLFTESLMYGSSSPALEVALKWVLRPLFVVGLVGCLRFWRNPLYSLMLTLVAGILLSSALVPIWDTGLRAYAASIVVGFTLLGLGCWFIIRGILWFIDRVHLPNWVAVPFQNLVRTAEVALVQDEASQDQGRDFLSLSIIWFTIFVVFFSAIFPVLMRVVIPRSQLVADACPAPQEARVIYYHPHSVIHLVADDQVSVSKIPTLKIGDFQSGLSFLKMIQHPIAEALETLKPEQTIVAIAGFEHVAAPTSMLPEQPGHYTVCGQKEQATQDTSMGMVFSIFSTESFKPVQRLPKPSDA